MYGSTPPTYKSAKYDSVIPMYDILQLPLAGPIASGKNRTVNHPIHTIPGVAVGR